MEFGIMGASILPFLTLFPLYRSLPVFLSVQLNNPRFLPSLF